MGWLAGRPGLKSRQGQDFSLLHSVQTDSGPIHYLIKLVPTPGSPRVKRQEREADHSLPFNTEVKNGGAITSTSPRVHCIFFN
jgi:hypothetical protein